MTRRIHAPELRREVTTVSRPVESRLAPSNSSAASLCFPTSISAARATDSGRPGFSSSPVIATTMRVSRSTPAASSARRA
ncbi:MAG TPA: hypothetical protein VGO40_14695 [Longimicrobium sp.]|nr:hypothetical protein [Longimicrobium sp.]